LANDRVQKVAAFVAEHFKENVLPLGYKAFLVAARCPCATDDSEVGLVLNAKHDHARD
jgi:hypothetical protein